MNGYAPNETLQLRELLNFKNLCLTKEVTMAPLISDPELKLIFEKDAATTEKHIKQLKSHMDKTDFAK